MRPGPAQRDHPERHPQGVHGPQHLHLPARAEHADRRPTSSSYTAQHMPRFNSISISGYHMQEAGATADLELAFTLADGVEYVRAAHRPRASTSTSSPARLSFFWAIGMNFFMEVAKLRAARLLWRRVMARSSSPKKPELADAAHPLPDLGLVAHRAGPLQQRRAHHASRRWPPCSGGTQSLHTNSFDEAIALPTDFSARIARNTQLIIQEETGITRRRRPAGRQLLRRGAHPRPGRRGLDASSRRSRRSAA